jgi:hypothetical protein
VFSGKGRDCRGCRIFEGAFRRSARVSRDNKKSFFREKIVPGYCEGRAARILAEKETFVWRKNKSRRGRGGVTVEFVEADTSRRQKPRVSR